MHQPKRPLSQTFYGVNQSASAAYSILHPDGGVNPTDFYASTVGSNAKGKKKDSELDDYHHPRNYSLFGDSEYHSQLQGLWKGRPTRNSSGTRDDADLTRAIELSKTERTRRSVRAEVHDHTQRTTLSGKYVFFKKYW